MSTPDNPHAQVLATDGLLRQLELLVARGRFDAASVLLAEAGGVVLQDHRVMRLHGVVLHQLARFPEAAEVWRQLTRLFPNDASLQNNLGGALGATGDLASAIPALRRACELAPEKPNHWYNLAKALAASSRAREACTVLDRLLELTPRDTKARLLLADCCKTCGRLEQAEMELRSILATDGDSIPAWSRLVSLKSAGLGSKEMARLAELYSNCAPTHPYRSSLGFAYGLALEAAGSYREAYSVLVEANRFKRQSLRWDADQHSRKVDALMLAFARPLARATDPTLGKQAILIFGMPRSGSTLLEQILSAHPDVATAGEVGDLSIVVEEESTRRGESLAEWAPKASGQDWARLGKLYLARMARAQHGKPMFTDKELGKWQLVGAAQAMLPGARFIYCERDPVETCWSCFKHEFERDQLYSYDFEELARYWNDCTRMVAFWRERFPKLVHRHVHEDLVADPEKEIRRLLEYCGLAFDPACIRFHEVEREVRTASAGQVRQPLMRQQRLVERYGPLLAPLRQALASVGASGDYRPG